MKFKIKNSSGTTLIELIVVIAIIAIFSMILAANFPRIMQQYALSRATYKLAQDIRRAEDMSLSGVYKILDAGGNIIPVLGYGIFFDRKDTKKYSLYAVVKGALAGVKPTTLCSLMSKSNGNYTYCIIETIDLSDANLNIAINSFADNATCSNCDWASISFYPPSPFISVRDSAIGFCNVCVEDADGNCINTCNLPGVSVPSEITVVLGLSSDANAKRTVYANTAGLIEVR